MVEWQWWKSCIGGLFNTTMKKITKSNIFWTKRLVWVKGHSFSQPDGGMKKIICVSIAHSLSRSRTSHGSLVPSKNDKSQILGSFPPKVDFPGTELSFLRGTRTWLVTHCMQKEPKCAKEWCTYDSENLHHWLLLWPYLLCIWFLSWSQQVKTHCGEGERGIERFSS